MEKTVRRQSVSRRTLLSGTAGLLGGAALSSGTVLAQTTTPTSTGAAPKSPYNPHYPDPAWLALRQEEIIEPELKIIDPHHHLWDRPGNRFLLDQLLADVRSGHKITETVFIECGSMYRADGPTEMKPVGETEFVNGTAAMSASGQYGPTRLCRGIVGYADLRLGDGVARVLEAQITAGDGRFRGIRHSVAWDASDVFPKGRTNLNNSSGRLAGVAGAEQALGFWYDLVAEAGSTGANGVRTRHAARYGDFAEFASGRRQAG